MAGEVEQRDFGVAGEKFTNRLLQVVLENCLRGARADHGVRSREVHGAVCVAFKDGLDGMRVVNATTKPCYVLVVINSDYQGFSHGSDRLSLTVFARPSCYLIVSESEVQAARRRTSPTAAVMCSRDSTSSRLASIHWKARMSRGYQWPDPWLSLNPSFASGGPISDLVTAGLLQPECERTLRPQGGLGDGPVP